MKVSLLSLLYLSHVANCAFPYYDSIHLAVTGLYAFFNPDQPIWTNVVFWGSFVESLDSTIDKAIDVCKACEANHKEPADWDCINASKNLAVSVVKNAISLYIGWSHAGTPNGSLEGQDTTALKKRLTARHCMEDEGYDYTCVSSWLSDFYKSGNTGGWHEVSYSHVKRDLGLPNIYLKDNQTSTVYHLIFNPNSETNGAIAMAVVGNSKNGTSLEKRADYPVYAPLCDSYIALDYCANQSKWGGIYQSGELQSMLEELLENDVNGRWKSDFYKMYTVDQNGKDEDWEISWRMYLAHTGNWIHWTQCDTGH